MCAVEVNFTFKGFGVCCCSKLYIQGVKCALLKTTLHSRGPVCAVEVNFTFKGSSVHC